MKIRIPVKMTSLILSSILSTGLGYFVKKNNKETSDKIYIEPKNQCNFLINQNENELELSSYIIALENINIYGSLSKKDKIGLLTKGNTLLLLNEYDNFYEVKYDGKSAFIEKNKVEIIYSYENPYDKGLINIDENNIKDILEEKEVVTAVASVNVREKANTKCEKLDKLSVGESLPYINETDEWYEVNYYGKSAYVFKKYAKKDINYYSKIDMADMVYATSKISLFDISTGEEITTIPRHEVLEVYGKKDNYYLVKCKGKFGYVLKDYVCSLGDDYVIIDISSQNLKAYVDDKLIVDTEVVTGKDSSPTYCGVFSVREKDTNVTWDEFKVTVKYWMPFNRGEGMHDASWRDEFGGDIYHKKGSHGCVNVNPKVMKKIYKNIDVGSIVLVKK